MSIYSLIAVLFSFLFTLYLIPKWIYRANKAGLIGRDMHKAGNRMIPEVGGLPVLCGFVAGVLIYVAFKVFAYKEIGEVYTLFAALVSVLIAAFIGFVDDILGWKIGLRQFQKALLTIGIAVPIMAINAGNSTMNLPFIGSYDFGIIYPLIIILIGIVATSNAFNMLAGFNGLEATNAVIILFTLSLISYSSGEYLAALLGACMVSALLAFLIFNWYPSRIFPGDTLTYSVGALIGIIAVIGNIEKYAIIAFGLYIVQFFLKARGLMQKESYGRLQKNGSIANQYNSPYGIEHIAISMLRKLRGRAYEIEIVFVITLAQALLCSLALALYYKII